MQAPCLQHTKHCANMQFRHDIFASAVALLQEQQQQQDVHLRMSMLAGSTMRLKESPVVAP